VRERSAAFGGWIGGYKAILLRSKLGRMPLDPGWSAERVLHVLLESLDEVVFVYDVEQRCRGVSGHVRAFFGVDAAGLLGQERGEILSRLRAAAGDAGRFDAAVEAAASRAQPIDLERPERRQVAWRMVSMEESGERSGVLDIVRDVTAERAVTLRLSEVERALAEATTLDPVTGLLNQRRFLQDLEREHRRAQRVWESYAVARLDVDGMSAQNAALGWSGGDALLRRIGEELRTSRREYDLVGHFHADEFILCFPGADAEAAKVVVDRALSSLYARVQEAFDRALTVSAGIAIWTPPSQDSPVDMVHRSGVALDAARAARQGGGRGLVIDARLSSWKGASSDE
jgi:diguanylate cyclase (GGDEF)-like protein